MSDDRRFIFAVGDVHGRLDLLKQVADRIDDFLEKEDAVGRVVMLGDYVDRGPQSREVVEFLMSAQRGGACDCLRGNHEQMFIDAYRSGDMYSSSSYHFLTNGGQETMQSYGWSGKGPVDWSIVPEEHIRWMERLPLVAADDHRVFVHAGLFPEVDTDKQKSTTCLWIRDQFLEAHPDRFVDKRHIVHGHTPQWALKADPAMPELLPHRTNLDTAAYHTGVLSVGVFANEKPGGPKFVWRVTL